MHTATSVHTFPIVISWKTFAKVYYFLTSTQTAFSVVGWALTQSILAENNDLRMSCSKLHEVWKENEVYMGGSMWIPFSNNWPWLRKCRVGTGVVDSMSSLNILVGCCVLQTEYLQMILFNISLETSSVCCLFDFSNSLLHNAVLWRKIWLKICSSKTHKNISVNIYLFLLQCVGLRNQLGYSLLIIIRNLNKICHWQKKNIINNKCDK